MSPKSHSIHRLLLAALVATSSAAPLLSSVDLRQLDTAERSGVERREIDIGAGIIAGEAPSPSKPAEVSDVELGPPLDTRGSERREWDPLGGGASPDRRARMIKRRRSDPSEATIADTVGAGIEDRAVAERQWNGLALADTPIYSRSHPKEKRQWDSLTLAAGSAGGDLESHLEEKRQWDSLGIAAGLVGVKSDSQLEEKRQWDPFALASGLAGGDSGSRLEKKRQWDFVALGAEHDPSEPLSAEKRQYDFLELGTDHDPSHSLSADKRQWDSLELGTDHDPSHPLSADK